MSRRRKCARVVGSQAPSVFGRQRSIGLRAARASSRRPTRDVCGAVVSERVVLAQKRGEVVCVEKAGWSLARQRAGWNLARQRAELRGGVDGRNVERRERRA